MPSLAVNAAIVASVGSALLRRRLIARNKNRESQESLETKIGDQYFASRRYSEKEGEIHGQIHGYEPTLGIIGPHCGIRVFKQSYGRPLVNSNLQARAFSWREGAYEMTSCAVGIGKTHRPSAYAIRNIDRMRYNRYTTER